MWYTNEITQYNRKTMPSKGKKVVKSPIITNKTKQQLVPINKTINSSPQQAAMPCDTVTKSLKSKQDASSSSSSAAVVVSALMLPSPEENEVITSPHDSSPSFPNNKPKANNSNNNNNTNVPNPSSGIDEVLNESDQLLRAAAEAQALGRLRNASTFLLLAHARLVGLGRRFDRSRIEIMESTASAAAHDDDDEKETKKKNKNHEDLISSNGDNSGGGKRGMNKAADSNNATIDPLIQLGDQSNMSLLQLPVDTHNGGGGNIAATASNNNNNNNEPMLFPHQTFHHMPDGVAYVEHLARAAMELHHKRTGRGMQHDAMVEKQNALTKAKQVEQEQIRLAARGLFATAKGFTGVNVGATIGSENSRGEAPTTRKRKATEAQLDTEEKNAMAKRKGGRGKKPPTLVMHTQYGQNADVHELMKGGLLN